MNKINVLLPIFIISIVSGVYFLINIFNSSNDFKDDFNEFETPSELNIELDPGIYDLFEMSTKLKGIEKYDIDYLISEKGRNPKIIEIGLDTIDSIFKNKKTITYTIYDEKFKSIGQFEINKKQSVKIVSNINDKRIDKLAYRKKETSKSFFGVMKFSGLLFFSTGVFLISGILLLITIKKNKQFPKI
ncbi:MAG: hypothetical protein R6W85_09925 [Gillisia sp.]